MQALIQGQIDGTSVCYCIDPKVWKQLKTTLDSFFVSYDAKDKCGSLFLFWIYKPYCIKPINQFYVRCLNTKFYLYAFTTQHEAKWPKTHF